MSEGSKTTGAPAENLPASVGQSWDFELTEKVRRESQGQRASLFENMYAVLKEKGDDVTEVAPEKYAEIILEYMVSSDHNYQIVASEILKHTFAIPYEETPEKFEKYLKDIKDFKEAAEKMKKGFGWVSFGEEGQQKKRVNKFIKILKEVIAYLEKIKKLDDEEKAGFDKPESEKKLTSGQKAVLEEKEDLKEHLAELEKELDLVEREQKENADAVVDFEEKRKGIKAAEAVTLEPAEDEKRDEAVKAESVPESKAANG
jgi:hypothetical protein